MPYLVLPSDRLQWGEDLIEAAYSLLGTMGLEDFHELRKPGLRGLHTIKPELAVYCDSMGYPRPRFWFGTRPPRKSTIGQESKVEDWLRQLATKPKDKPKMAYFAEAQKLFPGIPRNAFLRVWDKAVPASWSRPGPVIRSPQKELSRQQADLIYIILSDTPY